MIRRRTEITIGGMEAIEDEDLIPVQNIAITLTHNGYIKTFTSFYVSKHKTVGDVVYKEWVRMKMTLSNIY